MGDNAKTSTGVDLVANRLFLEKGNWKECTRRTPRALVEPTLHHVSVSLNGVTQTPLNVRIVGELGAFCLIDDCSSLPIASDQMVDVSLMVENKRFDFEGRIRFIQKDGFALEFTHPPDEARQMIHGLLEPEFLATTLSPYLSYTTIEPGASGTLIYSDGDSNSFQISLYDRKVLAVHFDLEVLDLRLTWRKSERRKSGLFIGENTDICDPKRILSFIKNLPGLTRELYGEIESILIAGKTL